MSRSVFIKIDLNFLETHEELMSLANDYLTKIGSTKWCFLIPGTNFELLFDKSITDGTRGYIYVQTKSSCSYPGKAFVHQCSVPLFRMFSSAEIIRY